MHRNGLKIDLDSKFPKNAYGICPTKTTHGGPTIDGTWLWPFRHGHRTSGAILWCLVVFGAGGVWVAGWCKDIPRMLIQNGIWGIWRPGWHLELFVTVLQTFLRSFCGIRVHCPARESQPSESAVAMRQCTWSKDCLGGVSQKVTTHMNASFRRKVQ